MFVLKMKITKYYEFRFLKSKRNKI